MFIKNNANKFLSLNEYHFFFFFFCRDVEVTALTSTSRCLPFQLRVVFALTTNHPMDHRQPTAHFQQLILPATASSISAMAYPEHPMILLFTIATTPEGNGFSGQPVILQVPIYLLLNFHPFL